MRRRFVGIATRISVATVLTACGIETRLRHWALGPRHFVLQQYLPLAVLKPRREHYIYE